MSLTIVAKAIGNLGLVSSRRQKVAMLQAADSRLLREVLKAAYDPYRTYGVKVQVSGGSVYVRGSLVHSTVQELREDDLFPSLMLLAERIKTGGQALDLIEVLLANCGKAEQLMIAGILNKDLGEGISAKTINEAFPGLIPEFVCSLAQTYEDKRVSFPAIAEVKYDGKRTLAVVTKEGVTKFSRNGIIEPGYSHIDQQLMKVREYLEADYVFDGELMFGMFGKRKQDDADFIVYDYVPLDAWTKKNYRKRQMERSDDLKLLLASSNAWPNIRKSEGRIVVNRRELEAFYQEVVSAGGEGLMVKDGNAPYVFGRGFHWLKMKPVKDVDVTIVGLDEGEGKYEGMVGALVVDFNGVTVRVGAGLTDAQRADFWDRAGAVMGQVAEVRYTEITPDGSLRFPRFVRLRDDK